MSDRRNDPRKGETMTTNALTADELNELAMRLAKAREAAHLALDALDADPEVTP